LTHARAREYHDFVRGGINSEPEGKGFRTAQKRKFLSLGVEVLEERPDRDVELREAEEGSVAKPRQDPALGHLDGAFDLGLVLGRPTPVGSAAEP